LIFVFNDNNNIYILMQNQTNELQHNLNLNFNFTDTTSIVTRDTFPCKQELNELFNENQFNRLLQYIKTQINTAQLENINFVRILNTQVQHYTPQIIANIKLFLTNKHYTIVDIEDIDNNTIGWKFSW